MPSQRQTVLQALREAGPRGLCISDMERIDWTAVLTMRNRIAELRRDRYPIVSERCTVHKHRSTVSRYRWAPPTITVTPNTKVITSNVVIVSIQARQNVSCNVDHQGEPCPWVQQAMAL